MRHFFPYFENIICTICSLSSVVFPEYWPVLEHSLRNLPILLLVLSLCYLLIPVDLPVRFSIYIFLYWSPSFPFYPSACNSLVCVIYISASLPSCNTHTHSDPLPLTLYRTITLTENVTKIYFFHLLWRGSYIYICLNSCPSVFSDGYFYSFDPITVGSPSLPFAHWRSYYSTFTSFTCTPMSPLFVQKYIGIRYIYTILLFLPGLLMLLCFHYSTLLAFNLLLNIILLKFHLVFRTVNINYLNINFPV